MILLASLQAMPTTDVVKPDLQNAKEYNADLGYCGKGENFD
ncbi:MAG TPA: hypothetical protein VM884_11215 [Flavisolibacter sp.]|nr:hypothetical protein [Flavisolibacter sp.]